MPFEYEEAERLADYLSGFPGMTAEVMKNNMYPLWKQDKGLIILQSKFTPISSQGFECRGLCDVDSVVINNSKEFYTIVDKFERLFKPKT